MMMSMMIDSSRAVRFPAGAAFCSSTTSSHYRPSGNLEEVSSSHVAARRLARPGSFDIPWKKSRSLNGVSASKRAGLLKNKIRATAEHLSSASDPSKQNGRMQYHPFEDIAELTSERNGEAILTPKETARTIVEANNNAMLMLTGLIGDDIHDNIIWPDVPYATDERGNIYFQVKNEEDVLQMLTSENNFVQAIVGFDTTELINEMEFLGPSDADFEIEEIHDEWSDFDDDDNEEEEEEDDDDGDFVVLEDDDEDEDEDEEEEDDDEEDETLGDWAKLETMRSYHPMYFAKKLTQVALNDPVDWMEQPPAGLAIRGLIRPASIEERSDIQRHMSNNQSHHSHINTVGEEVDSKLEHHDMVNDHKDESGAPRDDSIWAEDSEKDEVLRNGMSFYKLEMTKIQLISADGHHTMVEVEDYGKTQPDAVALSASKIISHLKAGGEKVTQALKSLCWRCKGIQVEEAALIGVDSLGFDLRVCSGTQIQTLRFAFNPQAISQYNAELQLHEFLFPRTRTHHRQSKKKQTHQNEL